ncbi:MAG: alginate lyase family protein [Phycisphaerae bacterium]|nr:alginate lyase family protein [Phycisphaerae bacterium]
MEPGASVEASGFRVTDMEVGEWDTEGQPPYGDWLAGLVEKANRIAEGRLSFFDLQEQDIGTPVDWHRDHKAGKSAPLIFSGSIDYRDHRQVGDCKFVWEPNRHHHLVVLARAYRAGGDRRYASAVVEQLESWLDQNPYGMGMNWRSPLELAIRLINWVWAIDLIRESGLAGGAFRARLYDSVERHLWEITRKYSRGSSANNHRVGEAAGVFIAATYFNPLRNARRWQAESRDILCEEIQAQTHADGGNREQAMGYHLFVLQFFLLAGIAGRKAGQDFPSSYWSVVEKMFEFAGAMIEGGDGPAMYGDCDDGMVLDLGAGPSDVRALLSVAALLFERPEFRTWAGEYGEPARWLLGRSGQQRFGDLPAMPKDAPVCSRAFSETGYYLLQSGHQNEADRISVFFDCGELGFRSIAAHGHADALSLSLRAFGRDILVDPGTYDYFTYPAWREYFRSTRAHNTIVVDGVDQSVMSGPFMWAERAEARCVAWEPSEHGGRVVGEHDGFMRLGDPVTHRRSVALDGLGREVFVEDEVVGEGDHDVMVCFHVSDGVRTDRGEGTTFVVTTDGGEVWITLDEKLSIQVFSGSEDPIAGWVSPGYHRKAIATSVVGTCRFRGGLRLRTQIRIGEPTVM